MRSTAILGILFLGCAPQGRFDPPSGAATYRDGSIAVVTTFPEPVARSAIEIAKETWRWLDERLAHVSDPAALRVTIFLYSSKADFERGAPRLMYEDRSGKTKDVPKIGLFLSGPREIGVFSGCSDKTGACKHLIPTLRHELVHAFLHAVVGGRFIPSYVDEGLARFVDSADWPPEDAGNDFRNPDNFLDFEEPAHFGAIPSVTAILSSPVSYEALAREFRALFTTALGDCSASLEDFENEYRAYLSDLRPRRFAHAFSWKADYVRHAILLDLKPLVEGKEVSFDSLSWEQLKSGQGFVLIRNASRVLATRIQDLFRKFGELRSVIVNVDAKAAPETMVGEVERMVDEIRELSDHCAVLRSRLGEKTYLDRLRAASRVATTSERLLENELHVVEGSAFFLCLWLHDRGE